MKLSTAAVIIAAGTSNVFSPNVVLAGKAGKLAPKASKAKTAKAHPSLSYGSGSYSMSTGPPPPPDVCPCWSQSELNEVTGDNVVEDVSCQVFENPGGDALDLAYESDPTFERKTFQVGPDLPSSSFTCAVIQGGDPPNRKTLTEEQYERCFQEIEDRCFDIGTPVETVRCPCFDQDDLEVVTKENVDGLDTDCPFKLSAEGGLIIFEMGGDVTTFCRRVENGIETTRQDTTGPEDGVCIRLVRNRCTELGLDDN